MKAGFFKQIITPPLGQIPFAGYTGRQNFPVGVYDDLFARILVLQPSSDPKEHVVIMTTDLFMMRYDFIQKIRKLITELTKIPESNICIHSIHSHQGPDTMGFYMPEHDFDASYLDEAWMHHLARQISGGVLGALRCSFPCKIGWTEGFLDNIVVNRRELGLFANAPPNPRTVDPRIGIIRIDDENGKPKIVLTSYATHPTMFNSLDEWAAEHVPFLEREFKAQMSDGVELMYFTAQAGDLTPRVLDESKPLVMDVVINPKKPLKKFRIALEIHDLQSNSAPYYSIPKLSAHLEKIECKNISYLISKLYQLFLIEATYDGQKDELSINSITDMKTLNVFFRRFAAHCLSIHRIGIFTDKYIAEVVQKVKEIETSVISEVKIDSQQVDVQVDDGDMVEQFKQIIDRANPEYLENGGARVKTEIQGILIGSCYIICWPSEPINEIGLRLKKLIVQDDKIDQVLFFELCNDTFGYVVTPFEHDASGYETTIFCFGRNNSPGLENATLEIASRLLKTTIPWEDVPLPVYNQAPWPIRRQEDREKYLAQK
jgi:Neutral/alkaline non-lysosomal ceramidase, N-terminal